MRKGISITVTSADRVRLDTIVRDRNSPQKHVWRARIVLLTADGNGTNAITQAVGKDKTVVWRWQERFMHEGIDGLIRDKTRPSRIPPLPTETVDRVIALTNQAPPHEATHWTALAMAKAVGISRPRCGGCGRGTGSSRIGCARSRSPTTPNLPTNSTRSLASTSIRRPNSLLIPAEAGNKSCCAQSRAMRFRRDHRPLSALGR